MYSIEEDGDDMGSELLRKMQSSLNSIFHLILAFISFPFWQAVVILTVEFLQTLYFFFYSPAKYEWNFQEGEDTMVFVTKILLVWPYLAEKSSLIFFIFFYFTGLLLCIVIGIFIMFMIIKLRKKSLVHNTVINVMGLILFLLQTVLYLPLITMYALILSCNNGYNVVISDYKCWSMEHYIHSIFSVLFCLIMVVIVFPTAAIYYESNSVSNNAFRKIDSSADLMQLGFNAILSFSLVLFNSSSNSVFIIYLQIILFLLLASSHLYYPRFFDNRMNRLWNVYSKMLVIASFCNLLSYFLSTYSFSGGLILLSLQSSLQLLYELTLSPGAEQYLCKPFSQIHGFDDYERTMRELSSLLANKFVDRESEMMIRGYISGHYRLCPCPNECPLGIAVRSNKGITEIMDKTQHVFKSMPLLVGHAEKMYEYYIENCVHHKASSRISFARFIINFSKEPTLAIKYLGQAQQMKLSIQEEFFIYRYERLLEESCKNKIAGDEGETINVLNVMRYERYQKEFNDLLEQNGLLHMQFWSSLLDESPSMTKVCDVGFKILVVNSVIEKFWNKIQDIYPNNARDLISYSTYLNQVWNDKETAEQISQRAKDSAYSNKYSTIFTTHLQDITNFSTDGSSCVYMSGNKGSIGKINNCNLAFCKLFGYFKKELIGTKINSLIPDLIADHHDKFILRNLDKIKISCCSLSSQDLSSVGLHKSHYIFPLSIKLISNPNLLNEMQYIAKVKIDKKLITGDICFLLLNTKGHVVSVSSSCLNMLNISNSTLNNYVVDMNVLAPSLFRKDLPYNCFHKNGSTLKVYHPKADQLAVDATIFKEDIEVLKKGEEVHEFQCFLNELSYEPVGHIGYLVRLDKKPSEVNVNNLRFVKYFPNFQFRYWETANRFVRENREDESSFASVYNNPVPRSPVLSSMSRGVTMSKMSQGACQPKELSQLSSKHFKVLSMRSRASSKDYSDMPLRRAIKSQFISDENKPSLKIQTEETPTGKDESNDQLRRQNSFVSIFNDSSAKLQRTKSKHSSYYEALVPKYRHLSRFANEDYGTFNLIKIIENKILYGENVKTLRLVDGLIEEVNEENISQLLVREFDNPELGLSEGRRNVSKHKEEEYKILKSRLKTKKDLYKLADESPYPKAMSVIKGFTLVCIGLLTALLISEYIYTRYRLQDITSATDMLGYSFELKSSLLHLWYDAREVFLATGTTYTVYQSVYPTSSVYIETLKQQIHKRTYEAHLLVEQLSSYPSSLSDENQQLINKALYPVYIYTSKTNATKYNATNYSAFQAILIEIEAFMKLSKLNTTEIMSSEFLMNTIVDTLYSSVLSLLNKIANIFYDLLESRSVSSDSLDYLILFMSLFDLLVCLIGSYFFVRYITQYEEKIMHIFLELPRKLCLHMNYEAETYIAEMQNAERNGEGDDMSEDENKDNHHSNVIGRERGGYERIYTHKKSLGVKFFISFVFLMIITEAYFVIQFILRSNFYKNMSQFSEIYESSYKEMVSYLEAMDIYREYLSNSSNTYGRLETLNSIVDNYWYNLYKVQKAYQQNNPTESSLLSKSSSEYIQELFSSNLCTRDKYTSLMSKSSTCETIGNKTVLLGLDSLKAYVTDSMKLVTYLSYSSPSAYLNSDLMWEIKKLHDWFIYPINEDITTLLKQSFEDSHNSQLRNRVIYLVVFTICLNILFAVLCYPFLTGMNYFVRRSRAMLSIIPVDCIIMCRGFEKLIIKHLKK